MMTKPDETGRATDPYEVWRELYETNERAWSAALEQTMGSAEFGKSSGKLLETLLAAQKSARDNMRVYLETMNVPTREDIARLGELVIGLEEKIDQLADRFDSVEAALRARPSAPATASSRDNTSSRAKASAPAQPRTGTTPRTPPNRAKPTKPANSARPAK